MEFGTRKAIGISNVVKCQYCGEEVERRSLKMKATCFPCKKENKKKQKAKKARGLKKSVVE